MRGFFNHSKSGTAREQGGFTLVEFAIVLLISALLFSVALEAYRSYRAQSQRSTVLADFDAIDVSLSTYASQYHGYPCPADPKLPSSDPNAGVADCSYKGGAVGTCDATSGICIAGGRDTIFDADSSPDPVMIGAVPYKTILQDASLGGGGFDKAALVNTLDPSGYKYTYAVTASLTDTWTKLPSGYGAIGIETEAGKSLISPAGSALYALVYHGPDHVGAYSAGGSIGTACNASAADYKNCNNGATFVNSVLNTTTGADHYDDIVHYLAYSLSTLWDFVPSSSDIYNVNIGNVGIGVDNPTQKLTVGDTSAAPPNPGIIKSDDSIYQQELCDSTGADCWSTDIFAGSTGIHCAAGPSANTAYVVNGIKNADVSCAATPVTLPSVIHNQNCPSGQFVYKIDGTGNISCKAP